MANAKRIAFLFRTVLLPSILLMKMMQEASRLFLIKSWSQRNREDLVSLHCAGIGNF